MIIIPLLLFFVFTTLQLLFIFRLCVAQSKRSSNSSRALSGNITDRFTKICASLPTIYLVFGE